jgi:hypothetical protein
MVIERRMWVRGDNELVHPFATKSDRVWRGKEEWREEGRVGKGRN